MKTDPLYNRLLELGWRGKLNEPDQRDLRAWLAAHRQQITVYWLPPYSPRLNLLERLWGHLKRTVLANVLYANLDDLVAAFRRGARRLTGNRERMGFMFDHDDLTQELQHHPKKIAA